MRRTSDSLNEGLPIRMARKKFQRKLQFSIKKIVGSTLELSAIRFFTLDNFLLKIWVENLVFAIQHIENGKGFTGVPAPHGQTNPYAYCRSFTFQTSYKKGMIGHGGGGGDVKMLKNNLL